MRALSLDPAPSAPPATWTAAHVKDRLRDACAIERRQPEPRLPRPRAVRSTWPTAYREFSDLVGWASEAREAELAAWARSRGGVFGYEISLMEEAFGWLALLARHPVERQCLEAWARAGSSRVKLRKVMRHMSIPKTTFYRRVEDGAGRIADHLNRHGVAVR